MSRLKTIKIVQLAHGYGKYQGGHPGMNEVGNNMAGEGVGEP